jgi:hypothetical protein
VLVRSRNAVDCDDLSDENDLVDATDSSPELCTLTKLGIFSSAIKWAGETVSCGGDDSDTLGITHMLLLRRDRGVLDVIGMLLDDR